MKYNFDTTLDHRFNGSTKWKQPEGRDDIIGLNTADLDYFCSPAVLRATKKVSEENTFNYRAKPDSYYNAVTGFYKRRFNVDIKREWVDQLPSTLGCVRLMIQCFCKPGDYVMMQTPYFNSLRTCIEGAGCRFLENPMVIREGKFEIDMEDFEKKIREYKPSMFLLVSPQNPTGRILSKELLSKMVDICYENNVIILSDEVHCLVTYDGLEFTPILGVSEKANKISILLTSMAKGFNTMSLPHVMFFIPDDDMRKKWTDFINPFEFYYASNSFTIAAITAVMDGSSDEWLDELNVYLAENRKILLEEVEKRKLPMKVYAPEASFVAWIDCRETGIDPDIINKVFEEKAGITVNNGLKHGEAGRGYIRFNFACTRDTLYKALDRMEKMFSEMNK